LRRFKILTLGCKVNTYEAEAIKLALLNRGYKLADKDVDVVIINTCAVTHTSEKKSRQLIRRMIRLHNRAIVAIMGCYSQIEANTIAEIDGVNIVIGTVDRLKIVDLIEQYILTKKSIVLINDLPQSINYEPMKVTHYTDKTRAFVKIQDGCNNYCSFCIIPYARGNQRSRNKVAILEEIKQLIGNGYKEIVLTGINTSGYGLDLVNYRFTDLITEILDANPDLFRLRISSIEISEITDRLLNLIATNKIMANHLHIPLQSGSDAILIKMNRKYTSDEYEKKVQQISKLIPNIAITTDVIVGFPNESEAEFLKTYHLAKRLGFAKIHVFPYSPRIGTVAYNLIDDVPASTKKQRVNRLIELSNILENKYASRFIGQQLDIIVEHHDDDKDVYIGHTSNYLKGFVNKKDLKIGDVVKIIYQQ
jgi:threonylcarbamoyladenosine tRNA methylthiotransferase MtaB